MIQPNSVRLAEKYPVIPQTSLPLAPLVRIWLTLRHRLLSRRYNRLVLEWVDGLPLLVLPQVFNPVLLRTGQFLAQSLTEFDLRGHRVLDVGSGSGIGAIFAALRGGATVTAMDINPQAVRCIRLNLWLHQLDHRVHLYQGDLLDGVAPQSFDWLLFNPPFYRGQAKDNLDLAWRGVNIFERLVTQLPRVLTPQGRLLLLLSSDGDGDALLTLLHQHGFTIEVARRHNLLNEVLTLYTVGNQSA